MPKAYMSLNPIETQLCMDGFLNYIYIYKWATLFGDGWEMREPTNLGEPREREWREGSQSPPTPFHEL